MVKNFLQFVNENLDEAKRLGIYTGGLIQMAIAQLEKAKGKIAYKILEFIYASGEKGVSHTEVLKFIIEDLKGRKYDHTTDRGYYATNLYGSSKGFYSQPVPGLYGIYCEKHEGRWRLKPEVMSFFNTQHAILGKLKPASLKLLGNILG